MNWFNKQFYEPNIYENFLRKILINEEMTINTQVSNLCFMIENAILEDMATQPVLSEDVMCQMGRITVYYKCNAQGIPLNAGDAISRASGVFIKYKVYILPQDTKDEDPIVRIVQAECGCETDFEKGFIRIATWMIGKKMQKGFVSEIQHEANHYFQNLKGQKKNESLYDRMVALFNAGDDYDREVCMSLYYSFTTEQDAFANQFYRYLMTNYLKKCIDYRTAMDLSIYPTFTSRVYSVEQFPNIFLNEILRDLGLSESEYKRRINQAQRRLKKKLTKAYMKYYWDRQSLIKEESTHKHPNPLPHNKHLDFWYN